MKADNKWIIISNRVRGLFPSMVALSVALLGTVGAFIATTLVRQTQDSYKRDQFERLELLEIEGKQASEQQAAVRRELEQSIVASKALQSSLMQAARSKGVVVYSQGLSPADRQELSSVLNSQSNLDKRLSSLEDALSVSPEKAIALPLMKQQIADMQEKNRGDIDNVHGEVGRLYSMMQWFLGLMATLIVGVGGLIVNNLRQRVEKVSTPVDIPAKG
jgi:hypothetical protein